MQVYSDRKNYVDTCKCWDCRRGRKVNWERARARKKGARRKAKEEIRKQLEGIRIG